MTAKIMPKKKTDKLSNQLDKGTYFCGEKQIIVSLTVKKGSKTANKAVARKLAILFYTLLNTLQPYDKNKSAGQAQKQQVNLLHRFLGRMGWDNDLLYPTRCIGLGYVGLSAHTEMVQLALNKKVRGSQDFHTFENTQLP
ncbi:hypothetical protein FACS189421_06160 [Bacteroidia bacterium]|nr:hypothetical protein FACS189421_06160 [Bacteroidia bacterium]GHT03387.1 hypothetical protein FACS189423_04170 [Bacteroidia bacterium]GHT45163.1 hypothetical protein FACS189440_00620 [Bacteroidia bacterium]